MELASEMRAVLERRRGSGLSLLADAKREDLSYSKLQYWARKFRAIEEKGRKAAASVGLTRVRVVPEDLQSYLGS